MFRGKVKKELFDVKGFGFIEPDAGQELPVAISRDVFCHISTIRRAGLDYLNIGDRVEFDLAKDRSGRWEARDLKLIDAPAPVKYGT